MERLFKSQKSEQNIKFCSTPLEGAQGYAFVIILSLDTNTHKALTRLVSTPTQVLEGVSQKNYTTHMSKDSTSSESGTKPHLAF